MFGKAITSRTLLVFIYKMDNLNMIIDFKSNGNIIYKLLVKVLVNGLKDKLR